MSAAEVAARIKTNEKHPPTIKDFDGAVVEAAATHAKQLASQ